MKTNSQEGAQTMQDIKKFKKKFKKFFDKEKVDEKYND